MSSDFAYTRRSIVEIVGVLSILEGSLKDEVLNLWERFEIQYDSKGVQTFDYPNISFQGGFCDDLDVLKSSLEKAVRMLKPYNIEIDGIGSFDIPTKVIYLKIVPTDELKVVHDMIKNIIVKCCKKVFEQYSPKFWIPHISIAMGDLTVEAFYQAKKDFKDFEFKRKQKISNINIVKVCNDTGKVNLLRSWELVDKGTV